MISLSPKGSITPRSHYYIAFGFPKVQEEKEGLEGPLKV